MFIKLYAIALPVFIIFDMLWLGVIAKNLYKREIGHLMKDVVNWQAAIIFYLLFIVGLVFFVILPSVQKGSLLYAILVGAFFWSYNLCYIRPDKSSHNSRLAVYDNDSGFALG
jgi:uncharacterized membrane protein